MGVCRRNVPLFENSGESSVAASARRSSISKLVRNTCPDVRRISNREPRIRCCSSRRAAHHPRPIDTLTDIRSSSPSSSSSPPRFDSNQPRFLLDDRLFSPLPSIGGKRIHVAGHILHDSNYATRTVQLRNRQHCTQSPTRNVSSNVPRVPSFPNCPQTPSSFFFFFFSATRARY